MRAIARRFLDGSFIDPADRYICTIFEATAAIVGADLLFGGAALGGEALAGGAALAGGEALGIGAGTAFATLPELAIEAPFLAGGIGEGAFGAGVTGAFGAGAGAAGLEFGGGGGGLDFGGGGVGPSGALSTGANVAGSLADTLGAGTGIGTGTGAPAVGAAPGISVEPLGSFAAPASGTSVGSPVAAAPIAPEAVPLSPTTTGDFGALGGAGDTTTGGGFSGTGPGAATLSGTPGGPGAGASTPFATSNTGTNTGLFGGLDKTLGEVTGGNLNLKDIGTIGSVGSLGMDLMKSGKPLPGEKQFNQAAGSLSATAGAQANEARVLSNYLNTGTLPPGLHQGLRTATDAAKAKIRSGYAARGMSGSSAEAQDMQAAEDRSTAEAASLALKLLKEGETFSGMAVNTESLAAQLYHQILNDSLAQDQELGKSIGNFASALAKAA